MTVFLFNSNHFYILVRKIKNLISMSNKLERVYHALVCNGTHQNHYNPKEASFSGVSVVLH